MKVWYKFWKKSGPMQGLDDDYFLLDEKYWPTEEDVKLKCESRAGEVGGGFNTHYSYGFEKVDKPPKEWIDKRIKQLKKTIKYRQKEIKEFKTYL